MCLSWNTPVNDQIAPRHLTVAGYTIPQQLRVAGSISS